MSDIKIKRKRGFTFVELMVVVAIMSALTALGASWMFRARENAKLAYCANNLTQLGKGTITFFTDRNDMPKFSFTVSPTQSDGTVDLYIQANRNSATGWDQFDPKSLLCPKDEDPIVIPVYNRTTKEVERRPVSYAYNLKFILEGGGLTTIDRLGDTALLFDGIMDLTAAGEGSGDSEQPNSKTKNNNGHGNNKDSVDSSNPGTGWVDKFEDSNPNVDDEKRLMPNNPDGVGELIHQGTWNPGGPAFGDSFFSRRHETNPMLGNVLFADGRVEQYDRTPNGYKDASDSTNGNGNKNKNK